MPQIEDFSDRADYYAALDRYFATLYGVADNHQQEG